jgi:hypothetical protein
MLEFPLFFILIVFIRAAMHVSRIKNQHQPIHLPQWHHHLQEDTASVISFTTNLDAEAASVYKPLVPAASTRSRNSNGGESITGHSVL